MFYTIFINNYNNRPIVAEIIPCPTESDIVRLVFDRNFAKYKIKHFIVRRLYDLETKQELEYLYITHKVYYKDLEWDGWVEYEKYYAGVLINVIKNNNISSKDFKTVCANRTRDIVYRSIINNKLGHLLLIIFYLFIYLFIY